MRDKSYRSKYETATVVHCNTLHLRSQWLMTGSDLAHRVKGRYMRNKRHLSQDEAEAKYKLRKKAVNDRNGTQSFQPNLGFLSFLR